MKKSSWMIVVAAMLLGGVALVPMAGCKKNAAAPEPVVVDYKPLFPAGTLVMGVQNCAVANTNDLLLEMDAAFTGKLYEVWSRCAELDPEVKASKESYDKSRGLYEEEFLREIGLKQDEVKWSAFSIGGIAIPTNPMAEEVTMPDCSFVLHSARPVDPVAVLGGMTNLFATAIRQTLTEIDEEIVDEMLANFGKAFSIRNGQWNGRPAVWLHPRDPEVTNVLRRFSPVLAQAGDGRLLVLASSEEALGAIADLYDGKVEPMEPDPAVAAAIAGTRSVYSAFALPGLADFIATALPSGQPVPAEVAGILPFVKELVAISSSLGTEGDRCFLELDAAFKDPQFADTLSGQVLMGKSAAGMVVAMGVPEPTLQSVAMQFLEGVSCSAAAGVLKLRISLSPALVEKIDAAAVARLVVQGDGALGTGEEIGAGSEEEDLDDGE